MQTLLGVDLGTSGLKVVAVAEDGGIVAEAEAGYEVDHPRPGWAEIDPQRWVTAVEGALNQLAPRLVRTQTVALGIDGQMHGLVLSDSRAAPVRPAVLWPDRRAESVLHRWHALSDEQRARLANPITPGMAGPILDWLVQHEPETVSAAVAALQPKDYVRMRLGGSALGDRSDASATLLWDVPASTWARDVIAALELPERLLPAAGLSDTPDGALRLRGLPEVPMVIGAGDTPAALLAMGGLAPGEVQLNLGSGAQVLLGVDRPQPVAQPVTHLYADAGMAWYAMAALQNAGLALSRMRRWLGLDWDDFYEAARHGQTGGGGVTIHPFLTGERGGVAGPASRGAWLGLTDTTTREDLARAAVEGVLFAVRRGLELLGAHPATIRLTGGGGRNPLVAQLLADVTGAVIARVPDRSASALGAAMLAGQACGITLPPLRAQGPQYSPAADPALAAAYELWLKRLGT